MITRRSVVSRIRRAVVRRNDGIGNTECRCRYLRRRLAGRLSGSQLRRDLGGDRRRYHQVPEEVRRVRVEGTGRGVQAVHGRGVRRHRERPCRRPGPRRLARREQLRFHLHGLRVRRADRRGAEPPGRHGVQLGAHRQDRQSLSEFRGHEGQDGSAQRPPFHLGISDSDRVLVQDGHARSTITSTRRCPAAISRPSWAC